MRSCTTVRFAVPVLVLILGLTSAVLAREPGAIPRTVDRIDINGELSEAAWQDAWSTDLPFEIYPGENIAAPARTEVLMMHDQSQIYVGFRVWDPDPTAIRAHLTDRDAAWDDDWVGIVLDTFNDERRNYLLVVNPCGVQIDNIEAWPSGGSEWDGIWDSAARITDWGWTVEMRIPFSTLRFQRSDQAQIWGFDAIRGYQRDRFRQMGAFARDRNNNCYLCQSIKIEGFDGVSPGRNLELQPTVTSSRTEHRESFPRGDFGEGENELEAGFTARWGFTPNLTLAATLNPDFSQVEADARQLDVNQPFALFFSEKRPFFMEGADFFNTQVNAVYTRMLREPTWGLKVTGKEATHTIGAYMVEDQITNLVFPGAEGSSTTSLDQKATASVARYKKDIGNRYTIGLLGTDRKGTGYRNSVAGADIDVRLSERDRISLQVLGSRTRYPNDLAARFDQPGDDFNDTAVDVSYSHSTRSLSLWAQASDLGDGFRADLGFVPQVDIRGGEVGTSYDWIGSDTTWYSQLNLKTKLERKENHDGDLLFEEQVVQFTVNGPLQSRSVVRIANGQEGISGRVFGADTAVLSTSLKPNRHSSIWLTLRAGDRLDYTNVRQGKRLYLAPGFWYQFGPHLRIEARHVFERMRVDPGRLYTANISETTIAWQFSSRSFIRAILQYVDYDFNVDLYGDNRDPRFQQLFSQLLYSYKLNPQTVLFLGYSDNFYGSRSYDLTRADRSVFAKVGYAWVF